MDFFDRFKRKNEENDYVKQENKEIKETNNETKPEIDEKKAEQILQEYVKPKDEMNNWIQQLTNAGYGKEVIESFKNEVENTVQNYIKDKKFYLLHMPNAEEHNKLQKEMLIKKIERKYKNKNTSNRRG